VADLFDDAQVATPMAVYTMTPFIGPGRSLPSFRGRHYSDSSASGGALDIRVSLNSPLRTSPSAIGRQQPC
jgi:hypothetical protein